MTPSARAYMGAHEDLYGYAPELERTSTSTWRVRLPNGQMSGCIQNRTLLMIAYNIRSRMRHTEER